MAAPMLPICSKAQPRVKLPLDWPSPIKTKPQAWGWRFPRCVGSRKGTARWWRGRPQKPPSNHQPPPIEVRVVAMPDRRSETTVERDARDNIEKTIRIECDVE